MQWVCVDEWVTFAKQVMKNQGVDIEKDGKNNQTCVPLAN